MALTVQVTESPDYKMVRVQLVGSLDTATAPELEARFDEIFAFQPKLLTFDMRHLSFLSSAGIRSFLRAKKRLKGSEGRLLFTELQPQIKKVFEIIKAADGLHIFGSVEELDRYLASIQDQFAD